MENAVLGFQFKTLALVMILLPTLASAEIYRWTDETGKVHYSDKKPPGVKAEKKAYLNVATPWRKVPKPERATNEGLAADDAAKTSGADPKVDPQSDEELSKDKNDKKSNKKTKRLKAKQASDADDSDATEPVRLNKKDKSSSTPAKRAADIKKTYKKAKEEYRKAN